MHTIATDVISLCKLLSYMYVMYYAMCILRATCCFVLCHDEVMCVTYDSWSSFRVHMLMLRAVSMMDRRSQVTRSSQ